MNAPLFHEAEALPDGISLTAPAAPARMTGYTAAFKALDNGRYDHDLPAGMRLAAAMLEGAEAGYHTFSDGQQRSLWRWVAVAVFCLEQAGQNGVVDVQHEDGRIIRAAVYEGRRGDMAIVPAVERMMLATHVEQAAARFFTSDQQRTLTTAMYRDMLTLRTTEPGVCLSSWGRTAFRLLHEWLEESLSDVPPDEPVPH